MIEQLARSFSLLHAFTHSRTHTRTLSLSLPILESFQGHEREGRRRPSAKTRRESFFFRPCLPRRTKVEARRRRHSVVCEEKICLRLWWAKYAVAVSVFLTHTRSCNAFQNYRPVHAQELARAYERNCDVVNDERKKFHLGLASAFTFEGCPKITRSPWSGQKFFVLS